jgi:hypothetical protein
MQRRKIALCAKTLVKCRVSYPLRSTALEGPISIPDLRPLSIGELLERLGDFVTGTTVVYEKSLVDAKPVWESPPAGQTGPATSFGSERLTPEEFALVEAFLNRHTSLPAEVRFTMADQIARQI